MFEVSSGDTQGSGVFQHKSENDRTRELLGGDVVIDNRGAYFDRRLKVQVDRPPPDMSEFALIMDEL